MSNLLPILIPLMLLIWPAVLVVVVMKSRKLREVEEGYSQRLTESCGVRYEDIREGKFNLTRPLARCSIYERFLLIAFGNRTFQINFEEIQGIEVKSFRFSTGIVLNHTSKALPKKIVIWPNSDSKLFDVIKGKLSNT